MILGTVDVLWGLLMLIVNGLRMSGVIDNYQTHDVSDAQEIGRHIGEIVAVVISVAALPVGGLSAFAGYRIRRAEAYPVALAAAILNMVPCYQTTCCGLVGLPLGIWALVTLMNVDVKATFR